MFSAKSKKGFLYRISPRPKTCSTLSLSLTVSPKKSSSKHNTKILHLLPSSSSPRNPKTNSHKRRHLDWHGMDNGVRSCDHIPIKIAAPSNSSNRRFSKSRFIDSFFSKSTELLRLFFHDCFIYSDFRELKVLKKYVLSAMEVLKDRFKRTRVVQRDNWDNLTIEFKGLIQQGSMVGLGFTYPFGLSTDVSSNKEFHWLASALVGIVFYQIECGAAVGKYEYSSSDGAIYQPSYGKCSSVDA